MMVSQSSHAGLILIANEKEFQVAGVCSKPALCQGYFMCLLVLLSENQLIKLVSTYFLKTCFKNI